jgi:hypothetical protein
MERPLMKTEVICSSDTQLSPTALLTVCIILVSRLAYSSETSADFHPTRRRYVPHGTVFTVNNCGEPRTLTYHNHVRIPLSTRPTHHSLLGFAGTYRYPNNTKLWLCICVVTYSCYQCGDYETSTGRVNSYYSSANDLQGRGRGLIEGIPGLAYSDWGVRLINKSRYEPKISYTCL